MKTLQSARSLASLIVFDIVCQIAIWRLFLWRLKLPCFSYALGWAFKNRAFIQAAPSLSKFLPLTWSQNREQEEILLKFSIIVRLEQLFVKISWICLASLALLPPFFFSKVPQSSSVQSRFNKHFQDTWAVKVYADLVHNGVAFIGIITQERDEEFPHFICFGKQAFCDLPWATAELNRKFRIMINAFLFWVGFTTYYSYYSYILILVILIFLHSREAAYGGDKEKTQGHRIREWFGLEGTLRILCSNRVCPGVQGSISWERCQCQIQDKHRLPGPQDSTFGA